jgi:exodeoxyribonuclease V alpha subunit
MIEAQIQIQVEDVRFYNDENGFSVFKARNIHNDRLVTVTGNFPPLSQGEMFELHGSWSEHKEFGAQFKTEVATAIRPSTKSAIKKFIQFVLFKDIKGLGEKAADRVVAHFGTSLFDVLEEDPDQLANVKGISRKHVDILTATWNEHKHHVNAVLFLSSHNISMGLAQKIVRKYGAKTQKLLEENPYRLAIEVSGVGFKTADSMAKALGIAVDSPRRIEAAILHTLVQAEDSGHCFLTNEQLMTQLIGLLEISEGQLAAQINPSLQALNDDRHMVTEQIYDSEKILQSYHYSQDLYEAEQYVRDYLIQLLDSEFQGIDPRTVESQHRILTWLDRFKEISGTALSERQLGAVKLAVTSKVFVLTGGPGVGKTTTANTMIKLLKAMGKTVLLAAPTGRAAQRLSEVSGLSAKTIHRLLEWNPSEGGFTRHEQNPLTADVIIIDESSMIDLRLAKHLLCAVHDRTQIIFIGDVDQLPSVGPGSFLADLIDSNRIPFVKLDEIFRQAQQSKIIQSAHALNKGELPVFDNSSGSDCRFFDAENNDRIKSIIKHLASDELTKFGWNPLKDIQILTPMNKGDIGNDQLNAELQELLNPPDSSHGEYKKKSITFRPHDKVIQVVNNYELSVFNGDIGFIRHVNAGGHKLMIEFGERLIGYNDEQANELRLAYAVTIHKSQGSEFPVVIIPTSMSHFVMLQRNLFYTGLTRARKLAIFVGNRAALALAAKQQQAKSRQTRLKELLQVSLEN